MFIRNQLLIINSKYNFNNFKNFLFLFINFLLDPHPQKKGNIYNINLLNDSNACVLTHFSCIFAGGKTPDIGSRTYTEIMREHFLKGEESEVCYLKFIFAFN